MKYNSVIFDWDGTLGMTLHIWLKSYRSELEKLGYNFSDKIIVSDFFYEHDKAIIKYPNINFETFFEDVVAQVNSHTLSIDTYPGAHEVLEKLKNNNITLTLVSSSPRKLVEKLLKQHNLDKYFKAFVAGDEVMMHKPNPEAFDQIIEIAKLNPKTTIIIGDSHNDILAAKSASVASCLFLPPENKIFYDFDKLKETNPDYTAENLNSFVNIVLNS